MQRLFERSYCARGLVVVIASAIVVSLVHAAVAHDNAGVMQFFNNPGPSAEPREPSYASGAREPAAVRPPAGVRPPATDARARPLTVHVAVRKPVKTHVAGNRAPVKSAPVLLDFGTIHNKPVLVSIFEDRTLRRGDAVMTYGGIRIFAGSKAWPYTPRDFMALAAVKIMDLHLRKTLAEIDSLPRDRTVTYDQFAIRTNWWTQ